MAPLESAGSYINHRLDKIASRVKVVPNHRLGGLRWRCTEGVAWGSWLAAPRPEGPSNYRTVTWPASRAPTRAATDIYCLPGYSQAGDDNSGKRLLSVSRQTTGKC